MTLNQTYYRFLCGCLGFCIVIGVLVNWAPSAINYDENCNCDSGDRADAVANGAAKYRSNAVQRQKLAILVPFRDRFDELLQFVPHMDRFLSSQGVPYHIYVVNQVDQFRFNRASLINAGFWHTERDYDYIAMHDVDLLPMNDQLKYAYPKDGPLHIAAPELHPKYHYPTYVGGILLITVAHFRLTNGMSNKYWGWGLEDDEFYVRLMDAGLKVTRPRNITTGTEDTFKHIHDRVHRRRDMVKCYNQLEETRRRDRETGLDTLRHTIRTVNNMTIDGVPLTVLNVQLHCDKVRTPWCDCEGAPVAGGGAAAASNANKSNKKAKH